MTETTNENKEVTLIPISSLPKDTVILTVPDTGKYYAIWDMKVKEEQEDGSGIIVYECCEVVGTNVTDRKLEESEIEFINDCIISALTKTVEEATRENKPEDEGC